MIKPLTFTQKLIAYGSLLSVLLCTAIGIAIFWQVLTQ